MNDQKETHRPAGAQPFYAQPMTGARVVSLIETRLLRRGDGKDTPIRIITQYWTFDGDLLFEFDPTPGVA